ncbi:hypothetical protein BDF14DRAFT_1881064 [Spinellus fusiger]|nr:hypothetical protein BDF14DRAFT_1881064 [Spinellus fusiger]
MASSAPLSILEQIVKPLSWRERHTCMLVCRGWYFTLKTLYEEEVVIRRPDQWTSLYASYTTEPKNESMSQHIRSLSIRCEVEMDSVIDFLSSLKRLQYLSIECGFPLTELSLRDNEKSLVVPRPLFPTLKTLDISVDMPVGVMELETLYSHSLNDEEEENEEKNSNELSDFIESFPFLKCVRLVIMESSSDSPYQWFNYFTRKFPAMEDLSLEYFLIIEKRISLEENLPIKRICVHDSNNSMAYDIFNHITTLSFDHLTSLSISITSLQNDIARTLLSKMNHRHLKDLTITCEPDPITYQLQRVSIDHLLQLETLTLINVHLEERQYKSENEDFYPLKRLTLKASKLSSDTLNDLLSMAGSLSYLTLYHCTFVSSLLEKEDSHESIFNDNHVSLHSRHLSLRSLDIHHLAICNSAAIHAIRHPYQPAFFHVTQVSKQKGPYIMKMKPMLQKKRYSHRDDKHLLTLPILT